MGNYPAENRSAIESYKENERSKFDLTKEQANKSVNNNSRFGTQASPDTDH